MKIVLLKRKCLTLFILMLSFISFGAQSVEFEFKVTVDKQTCKLSVTGTSNNEVDFGSIQASKIKNNLVDPIPIKLLLTDCKTDDFSDTYVKMAAKATLNTVTFNDDITKSFGIRVSESGTATQSNNDTDFIKSGDIVWTNIDKKSLEKKLYTYVKCKTGTACEPEAGEFFSTLTFSYYVD